MRRGDGVVLGLALALAAAPSAGAAAPWSAPRDISAAHFYVLDPALTAAPNGTLVATWTQADDAVGAAQQDAVSLQPPGEAAFGRPLPAAAGRVAGPVAYGRDRLVVAKRRARGSAQELAVSVARAGGPWEPAQPITHQGFPSRPSLAADARGDLALAWTATVRHRPSVRVSLRPAGGAFGPPVTLASGTVRALTAAVGPRGDVLVAWVDGARRLNVRRKSVAAHRFGSPEQIRSRPFEPGSLRAEVSRQGGAVIVWGNVRYRGGTTISAAVQPPSARRFGPAAHLDGFRSNPSPERGSVHLVLDDAGRATAAWTGGEPSRTEARVATTSPEGRFGRPHTVSDWRIEARVTDLAGTPAGHRLVVWDEGPAATVHVGAALAPPGGPFATPEVVSDSAGTFTGRGAFDRTTGMPTVAWIDAPSGFNAGAVRLRGAQRSLR